MCAPYNSETPLKGATERGRLPGRERMNEAFGVWNLGLTQILGFVVSWFGGSLSRILRRVAELCMSPSAVLSSQKEAEKGGSFCTERARESERALPASWLYDEKELICPYFGRLSAR